MGTITPGRYTAAVRQVASGRTSGPAPHERWSPAAVKGSGLRLERLDVGDPRWRRFVTAHPAALPCHHPEWAALLAECYSLEPFVLAHIAQNGEVRAGLPMISVGGRLRQRSWISLPFTDYCPPLLGPQENEEALAGALDAARDDEGVAAIEVRAPLNFGEPLPPVAFEHLLALTRDPADAFELFHRSQVRAIRRVERDRELTIRRASSPEELTDVFYRLHLDTRRRLGAPIQPRRFFRLLWERMIEPGLGFLLLAHTRRRAVAGAVFLRSANTLLYKYSASDRSAWGLRPNHLVIWSAIQGACRDSHKQFDFGRTELAHESLRSFKSSWGAREWPLAYTRLTSEGIGGVQLGSNPLLAAAIRHSPKLLCRLAGELLYGYAA